LLAAFRIVLELFIEEEELFSGREDEIAATVGAFQNLVDEIHPASLAFARSTRSYSAKVTARPDRTGTGCMPAYCDTPDNGRHDTSDLDKGPLRRPGDSGPGRIEFLQRSCLETAAAAVEFAAKNNTGKAGKVDVRENGL
jgi:hypothetical protein